MFFKLFLQEWKLHIFILIQLSLVIFMTNNQISYCVEYYNQISCVIETGDDLFFYNNILGNLNQEEESGDFETQKKFLSKMPGYKGIAYQDCLSCSVLDYVNSSNDEEGFDSIVSQYHLNPLLYQSIQYKLVEGRWFTEADETSDELKIIIGGGLSEKYRVGDTITLQYDNGSEYNAKIIGNLGAKHQLIEQNSFNSEAGDITGYTSPFSEKEDTILSNSEKLLREQGDMLGNPMNSVMLKIEKGTDLTEYGKYGVISSFDEVMERTNKKVNNYLFYVIETNFIWILLALFGIASTAYISAREKKYTNGILLLLGMPNKKIQRIYLIQSFSLVLLASFLAYGIKVTLETFMEIEKYSFSIANWLGMVILGALLLMIDWLFRGYTKRLQPVEIFNMTKE